jgi:hypothetical protein
MALLAPLLVLGAPKVEMGKAAMIEVEKVINGERHGGAESRQPLSGNLRLTRARVPG